jgi:hypothetical protein
MLPSHAINHGTTDYRVEPGLQEIKEAMFGGRIRFAPANGELLEQMRMLHRDDDFRPVKGHDHLVDALRYAVMMRRSGKATADCQGVGFGPQPYASQQPGAPRRAARFARGTAGHEDGDMNPFTGR